MNPDRPVTSQVGISCLLLKSRLTQDVQLTAKPRDLEKGQPSSEPQGNNVSIPPAGTEDNKLKFRKTARIWALYLEDAEHDARERAAMWNASLDSLLTFVSIPVFLDFERFIYTASEAGLFAGVVATFIIDAWPDIQVETEQSLLKDIRDSAPTPSDVPISRSAICLNILWLLSLQMTLFVAVMGVLAKHWLTKYAPGSTKPRDAESACRRFRLDKQAEFVEILITHVPLVFQTHFVSLIFLIGLIIWAFNDNHTIGTVLLASLLVGIVAYLGIPLVPSSPFKTPLYDFFVWLIRQDAPSESMDHPTQMCNGDDKDDNQVLFRILCKMFRSLKSEHVEEAAAEMIHPLFERKWIRDLCLEGIPTDLLSRIELCASARSDTPEARNVILRNHLHAFLQFVRYFRDNLNDLDESSRVGLIGTFRQILNPRHPIHQSSNLHEGLTPLLFVLRAQILILVQRIPNFQHETDYTKPEFDFRPAKISQSDRPSSWELALWDIHSQDRLYLMTTACRGVLQGKEKLKETSISILSLRLAKGMLLNPLYATSLTVLPLKLDILRWKLGA
jgi:hypothetical protein